MRNDDADTIRALPMSTTRHRVRAAGLCLLAGAAVLAAAVAANPAATRPTSGAIVAPSRIAPTLALDDDHPIQNKAGLTRAAATGAPGYVLMDRHLIGETPIGLNVWVNPKAPHRSAIAVRASRTVTELRRLGLPVRWRGYGTPKAAEGVVQINENQSGCQGGRNVIGMTWPYWMSLPNGDLYTYRANIALCPGLFTKYGSWQWDATIRHEIGHAVGLGHTNYVYRSSHQVMNAVTHNGVTRYRAGDVNGLRRLAANNNRVKSERPALGHFDRSSWTTGNRITFTGWALLTYYKPHHVIITLTDNGKVIARHATSVVRADVNKRYDPGHRTHGFSLSIPWHGGRHSYCVTATSPLNRVSVAHLGCVTWQG
ncbi:MAG TPA: hypothetical protein VGL39_13380 [Jatrophihabitantaceae bacterium]|jgi:hypothetical protein